MTDAGNIGTLVRSKLWFDGGFTMIPNTWIRDKRLSPAALGVLVKLTSHEAGYEVTIRGLAAGLPVGVDAIRTAVGELERAGYLKRYRRRERGQWKGTDWRLIDPHAPVDKSDQLDLPAEPPMKSYPQAAEENAWSEPRRLEPDVVEPDVVEPDVENPTTKEDQLKEDLYTDSDSATDARVAGDDFPSVCHHPKIPDDGRCLYACRQDFIRRQAIDAARLSVLA